MRRKKFSEIFAFALISLFLFIILGAGFTLAEARQRNFCFVPESLLLSYPEKRGDFVSCYTSPPQTVKDWLCKFDIVEIGGVGDIASQKTLNYLKKHGVKKVFCYDWMPAVYYYTSGENYDFTDWVYENRQIATLNPNGPFPHTAEMGYDFAKDYYLDFGNKEVIKKRVSFITKIISENFYSGVFWDWAPGVFINEPEFSVMKNNFVQRHPGEKYSDAVGEFYSALRKKCDNLGFEIFTNQGYRNAKNVLPYADYDMAESYATDYFYPGKKIRVKGYGEIDMPQTLYFPVSPDGRPDFYDTLFYADYVENLVKKYGGKHFKKFVFMNYAAPEFVYDKDSGEYLARPPKDAIYLSFATAKLVDETAYLEVPFDKNLEKDRVYFVRLGKAFGKNFVINKKGNFAVCYFENGISLVYFGEKTEKTIILESKFMPKSGYFFDVYAGKWEVFSGGKIVLHIETRKDPLTGKTVPAGRIIMYNKHISNVLPVILPF